MEGKSIVKKRKNTIFNIEKRRYNYIVKLKKIMTMKKSLFIAMFGMLFLVACSNKSKQAEAVEEETATEQVQEETNEVIEEAVEEVADSASIETETEEVAQ